MSQDLPPLPPINPGRYRHYKGGEYEVLGVVRHSETLEPLVLYRPLYQDSGSWVRPFAMFLEPVSHDGRIEPRFVRLDDQAATLEDLQETVQRLESRLGGSGRPEIRQWMDCYAGVAARFERDLAPDPRDVALAKASALMLVQAANQAAVDAAPPRLLP